MVADHEIFTRPFRVTLTFTDVGVSSSYRRYHNGRDLPPTIPGWVVHDEIEGTYGLVSDPFGFEDSPDCEYISSGLNSKAVNSVALGRQGNWFLWGFCGPPATLTEEAKLVFVNTVVYMRQFDGQRAYGTAGKRGRDWVLSYCGWLDEEGAREYYLERFDPGLLAAADSSGARLAELFAQNMEYVYVDDDDRWTIDEDARALGLSNRRPELIEACIGLLESNDGEAERARRLLTRYTEVTFPSAAEWRSWFRANRRRLYFTDTGGYRFKVRPD